jgi:hypothetical protein
MKDVVITSCYWFYHIAFAPMRITPLGYTYKNSVQVPLSCCVVRIRGKRDICNHEAGGYRRQWFVAVCMAYPVDESIFFANGALVGSHYTQNTRT